MAKIQNYRALEVKYLGPTNSSGSKIKIIDHRFDKSKAIPYNHSENSALDGAVSYLEKLGIKFLGKAESKDSMFLFTDNFSTDITIKPYEIKEISEDKFNKINKENSTKIGSEKYVLKHMSGSLKDIEDYAVSLQKEDKKFIVYKKQGVSKDGKYKGKNVWIVLTKAGFFD